MGIGFALIGVAFYVFLFAESSTTYTPYSMESDDWMLHLPAGIDYTVNSFLVVSALLGSAALGISLLIISAMLKIRIFSNRSNPRTP